MTYPNIIEIRQFWDTWKTPENVRQHCKLVGNIAGFLAFSMDIDADPFFCEAAGLLHDSLKYVDFVNFKGEASEEDKRLWDSMRQKYGKSPIKGIEPHEYAIFDILKEEYPKLAEALICHGYSAIASELKPKTWEQKLLSYADKRCMHDKIASLGQRFEEGHSRYSTLKEISEGIDPLFFDLEKEIFSHLDFSPEQLEQKMFDIKCVIFDLDGVLVDSLPVLYGCHIEACKDLGIKVPFKDFSEFGSFFAKSWIDGVKKLAGERNKEYWNIYREKMFSKATEFKVFPGIMEMLEKAGKTKKLCIVSDSRDKYVFPSLEANNITQFFSHIVPGNFADKPDPNGILDCLKKINVWKTQAIFVGDMKVDIEAADNANVRCVAVSYGYHERKHLNGAWKIADSVQELEKVIS
jgi:phosphoglycolate phosphatase